MLENSMTNPLRMRRGWILPRHSTMTGVECVSTARRSWLRSLVCEHLHRAHFTIIDHTQGPGWMSDAYEGVCCTECGRMTEIKRTW